MAHAPNPVPPDPTAPHFTPVGSVDRPTTHFGAIFTAMVTPFDAVAGRRELAYFSMSYSAPHLFGDRIEDFASEVRKLLNSRSPEGIFWDWPGDTEMVLARKPG
jgi:hypothetical protein